MVSVTTSGVDRNVSFMARSFKASTAQKNLRSDLQHRNIAIRNQRWRARSDGEFSAVRQGSLTTLTLDASTITLVQARPVIIQLENTVGKNGGVGSKLECSLEGLTREDADTAKDNKNLCIIDAESSDDGVAIPVSSLEDLCIATGGSLAKLEIKG